MELGALRANSIIQKMILLNVSKIIPVYFFVHSRLESLVGDDFWDIQPRRKTREMTDICSLV